MEDLNNGKELLADKRIREKAEKEAAKAAKEAEKEAAKAEKGANKDVTDFFSQYPKATKVLKVGDCLFLPNSQGAAVEYSKRIEAEIKEIVNPNL